MSAEEVPDLTREETRRFNHLLSRHVQSGLRADAAMAVAQMYASLVNSTDPRTILGVRKALTHLEAAERVLPTGDES